MELSLRRRNAPDDHVGWRDRPRGLLPSRTQRWSRRQHRGRPGLRCGPSGRRRGVNGVDRCCRCNRRHGQRRRRPLASGRCSEWHAIPCLDGTGGRAGSGQRYQLVYERRRAAQRHGRQWRRNQRNAARPEFVLRAAASGQRRAPIGQSWTNRGSVWRHDHLPHHGHERGWDDSNHDRAYRCAAAGHRARRPDEPVFVDVGRGSRDLADRRVGA